MSKIILRISYLIIALALVTVISWVSRHEALGDEKLGWFGSAIEEMSMFPDLFEQSVEEVASEPPTYLDTHPDFTGFNKLDKDLLVVQSYSTSSNERAVVIKNLKTDSVHFKWEIVHPLALEHNRILNAIPLENNDLVFGWEGFTGLRKIDSEGNELWKNDKVTIHHSYNLFEDSVLWACTYSLDTMGSFINKGAYKVDNYQVRFIDNAITSYSLETGEILYHKSIAEIFKENKLEHLITSSPRHSDPLHLNDLDIASMDNELMKKGDVFMSFRNISALIQYRPKTKEVIRFVTGEFSCQHDVDLLGNGSVLFFNNNSTVLNNMYSDKINVPVSSEEIYMQDVYSKVSIWNLKENSISSVGLDSVMNVNEIFTFTEGLVEVLDSTDYFIEEQNSGILWVLNDKEVKYKAVFPTSEEGYHHLPNWTRILKYE